MQTTALIGNVLKSGHTCIKSQVRISILTPLKLVSLALLSPCMRTLGRDTFQLPVSSSEFAVFPTPVITFLLVPSLCQGSTFRKRGSDVQGATRRIQPSQQDPRWQKRVDVDSDDQLIESELISGGLQATWTLLPHQPSFKFGT